MSRNRHSRSKTKKQVTKKPVVETAVVKDYNKVTAPPTKTNYSSGSFSTYIKKDCTHWKQPVKIGKGVTIHCSGSRHKPTWKEQEDGADVSLPEIGIFFASAWKPSTDNFVTPKWKGPHIPVTKEEVDTELAVLDWRDMSVPDNTEMVLEVLQYGMDEAKKGRFVEIGCIGGHGRTGSALAAMLIMQGEWDYEKACTWVWDNYCKHAIETDSQVIWLSYIAHLFHPDKAKSPIDVKAEMEAKKEAKKQAESANKKKSIIDKGKVDESKVVKITDVRGEQIAKLFLKGDIHVVLLPLKDGVRYLYDSIMELAVPLPTQMKAQSDDDYLLKLTSSLKEAMPDWATTGPVADTGKTSTQLPSKVDTSKKHNTSSFGDSNDDDLYQEWWAHNATLFNVNPETGECLICKKSMADCECPVNMEGLGGIF